MQGIDFLYQNATFAMDDEILPMSFIPPTDSMCNCCGRSTREWPRPEAVAGKHYGIDTIHCIPCQTLFHGSFKYLGIERTAKGSTGAIEVPGKLGMLASCALLVTTSKAVVYTGDGYWQKLGKATASFLTLERATGFQQIMRLIERNPEPPFLFIADLGRKKSELVSNLSVTTRGNEWNLCSATEISSINPQLIAQLLGKIHTSGMDSDLVSKWLGTLRKVSTGYILSNDRAVVQLSDQLPEFRRSILPLLPQDPYLRIDTLRIVAKLMEPHYGRL